jgi:hypothetical protein
LEGVVPAVVLGLPLKLKPVDIIQSFLTPSATICRG